MYVIQVNDQDWLVGIWRGWLTLSLSPSAALVYRSLAAAENAISYYNEVAPGRDYAVKPACVAIEPLPQR
ncbi:hypothetical protein [Stenomitos frigidus]|uniref:Uncharacterized protein n=1 Tax=Stenomitos frigidus ULC18 TaxID=2107698 RepID=A0A2T1DZP6_9CYAN|nr:hypothetical protein [Stenomitos frigidus]PSB25967.1 hypothetical protein C7B82_20905 [Stenomitos frigidus ULC18]